MSSFRGWHTSSSNTSQRTLQMALTASTSVRELPSPVAGGGEQEAPEVDLLPPSRQQSRSMRGAPPSPINGGGGSRWSGASVSNGSSGNSTPTATVGLLAHGADSPHTSTAEATNDEDGTTWSEVKLNGLGPGQGRPRPSSASGPRGSAASAADLSRGGGRPRSMQLSDLHRVASFRMTTTETIQSTDELLDCTTVAEMDQKIVEREQAIIQNTVDVGALTARQRARLSVAFAAPPSTCWSRFDFMWRLWWSRLLGSGRKGSIGSPVNETVEVSDESRLEQAALHVEDAVHERPVRLRSASAVSLYIYWLYYHSITRATITLVILLNMLLAIWEPNGDDGEDYVNGFGVLSKRSVDGQILLYIEWACFGVLCLDNIAKMIAVGPDNFFATYYGGNTSGAELVLRRGERWDHFRIGLLALMCLDMLLYMYGITTLRFFRLLRPLWLVVYVSELRRWLFLSWKLLPKLLEMTILILILIVLYGVIGVLLFRHTDFYQNDPLQNFDNIGTAGLALFVLYTSDNFPEVMYPASVQSPWYTIYFLSFLILGMFCLANLVVPILYKSFREHHVRLALGVLLDERRSLLAAFHLLDPDNTGQITASVFLQLVQRLRRQAKAEEMLPRLIMREMRELHAASVKSRERRLGPESSRGERVGVASNAAAKSKAGGLLSTPRRLSVMEAPQALARRSDGGRLGSVSESSDHHDDAQEDVGEMPVLESFDDDKITVMEFLHIGEVINRTYRKYRTDYFVKSAPRRLMEHPITTGVFTALAVLTTGVIACISWAEEEVRICATVLLGAGLLEHIARIMMFRNLFFRSRVSKFDLSVVIVALALRILIEVLPSLQELTHLNELWLMVLSLRLLRVLAVVPAFRATILTAVSIARFMAIIFTVIVLLMYSFAIVGTESFGNQVLDATQRAELEDPPVWLDTRLSFDTFLVSMLALFQMVTTSNWHNVMYTVMWSTSSKAGAAVYFVSFYFITVTYMLSLVIAIYIDAFETAQKISAEAEKQRVIQDVLKPQAKKAAQMLGDKTEFYKIKGSHRLNTLSSYLTQRREEMSAFQDATRAPSYVASASRRNLLDGFKSKPIATTTTTASGRPKTGKFAPRDTVEMTSRRPLSSMNPRGQMVMNPAFTSLRNFANGSAPPSAQ